MWPSGDRVSAMRARPPGGWPVLIVLALSGLLAAGAAAALPDGATAAAAEALPLDQRDAVRFSQSRIGSAPGDFVLRDRQGRPVALSEYRGKPLLVNFVFTGCFHACPTSTRALLRAVDGMRDRFGPNQFNVVSIGFNQPDDTPAAMKTFAQQNRISDPNWEFLSPRSQDVAALTEAFGFRFQPSPAGFDHTVQVSLLDAQGVIRRQVYGESFDATELGEPIRAMLRGSLLEPQPSLADLLDRVRIVCSVYDPQTGRYHADYTLLLEIAGGITFFVAMLWFGIAEMRGRRKQRARAVREAADGI